MKRPYYLYKKVTDDIVFIEDCGAPECLTITNDAEFVVRGVYKIYGNRRIIYRDTYGTWDELIHNNGTFETYRFLTNEERRQHGLI